MEMEGREQGKGRRRGRVGWRHGGEGYGGHGPLSVASWTHLRGGHGGQHYRRSWGTSV